MGSLSEEVRTEILCGHICDLEAENAKLRELVKSVLVLRHDSVFKWLDAAMVEVCGTSFTAQARELGVEADE